MRTISFIAAFAVLFLGPSLAGTSATGNLPSVGAFEYNGAAPQSEAPVLMAQLR